MTALEIYRDTFETVTPESAEQGEAADSGFVLQDEKILYRDLIELLRGTEPSTFPICEDAWYSLDLGITDYATATTESRSYHGQCQYDRSLICYGGPLPVAIPSPQRNQQSPGGRSLCARQSRKPKRCAASVPRRYMTNTPGPASAVVPDGRTLCRIMIMPGSVIVVTGYVETVSSYSAKPAKKPLTPRSRVT